MQTFQKTTTKVEEFLAREYYCTPQNLKEKGIVYTVNPTSEKPFIKIMAYRNCTLVCTSANLQAQVQELLQGKNRDEIFELPLVYGQTIHYVPECKPVTSPPAPAHYRCELLFNKDILSLAGLTDFENSLAFDQDGTTPTKAVCVAWHGQHIAGIAGAAPSTVDGFWEIGIDVADGHRYTGLGTYLVSTLTQELLAQDIVPFYSASVTNIASQMVANRCGYVPSWVDTFGNVLDGSSTYPSTLYNLSIFSSMSR